MEILIAWIVSAAAIGITAYLIPAASVTVSGALIAAVVLGLLNAFIKPLIVLVTLPINILTLGLFTFVINAVIILIAARFVPGFEVGDFWMALLFGIVLAVVNVVLFSLVGKS